MSIFKGRHLVVDGYEIRQCVRISDQIKKMQKMIVQAGWKMSPPKMGKKRTSDILQEEKEVLVFERFAFLKTLTPDNIVWREVK